MTDDARSPWPPPDRAGGRLRLWVTEDTVRCEVTDDGPPKPADGTDAGPRDMALWPVEPGHALWLIRQVADQASWDAGPSGTTATVSFSLGSATRCGWPSYGDDARR